MQLKETILLRDSLSCLVNCCKEENNFGFIWHLELYLPFAFLWLSPEKTWPFRVQVRLVLDLDTFFPSCWDGVAKIWFASSPWKSPFSALNCKFWVFLIWDTGYLPRATLRSSSSVKSLQSIHYFDFSLDNRNWNTAQKFWHVRTFYFLYTV